MSPIERRAVRGAISSRSAPPCAGRLWLSEDVALLCCSSRRPTAPRQRREVRLDAIGALAAAARTHGAAFVLVAGDVFDSAEPGDRVFRQALSRMGSAADLRWILLPGNHDPARPDGFWSRLAAEAPRNVVAATEPTPLALLDNFYLLPAPLAFKRTVQDPTAWFDTAETPTGVRRLGLAHGSIQDFGVGETATNQIAPDRGRRAGLDYLALGDWHSRKSRPRP